MIEQQFQFMGEEEKYRALGRLLEREMDGSRLLIFCETKRGCDAVTRQLRTEGWPALSIHGDKSQQERDWVLAVRSQAPAVAPSIDSVSTTTSEASAKGACVLCCTGMFCALSIPAGIMSRTIASTFKKAFHVGQG